MHFVRLEFTPPASAAMRVGAAVKLGCDHANYPSEVSLSPETLASLADDMI